jgi:NCAIR mutase (PurE)-related protein
MNLDELASIVQQVSSGQITWEEAYGKLRVLSYEDLEFAKVDCHRSLRQAVPEVIFGIGKTAPQIFKIAESLLKHNKVVVVTKVDSNVAEQVLSLLPTGQYHEQARMITWGDFPEPEPRATVSVVTAGTADLPIAEECALYLVASGVCVNRVADVGVAGIHRLFSHLDSIKRSQAVIVIAGMEGALASVVGGLVSVPVIAVPTSIGYGASFQGLSALLTMLTSCAAGLTVVNIDNGFGAAMAALRILNLVSSDRVEGWFGDTTGDAKTN